MKTRFWSLMLFLSLIFFVSAQDDGTTPRPDSKEYFMGDRGPGGGMVVFDKGERTDGWRYMEFAPEELGTLSWSKALEACEAYDYGSVTWHLPSKEELERLYIAHKAGLGSFVKKVYWSSSRFNATSSWVQSFGDGSVGTDTVNNENRVRPVRLF